MSHTAQTILVLGATGQQGGAMIRILLARGWRVRAFVRDPEKPKAQILQQQGAELFKGDLDDKASLFTAMQDISGVFSVLPTYPLINIEDEIRWGKTIVDVASSRNVRHFIYSSTAGAVPGSSVPIFESKWQIEQYIHSCALPTTILRPTVFMENFQYGSMKPKIVDGTLILTLPLRPQTRLQMIAVDDLAQLATIAFEYPDTFIGKSLDIAGDILTVSQIAEVLGREAKLPACFIEQSLTSTHVQSKVVYSMFSWLNTNTFQANIPALQHIHPSLKTLEVWLREHNYQA